MSEWPTYSIQLQRGIFHSWSLWPQVSFSVSLSVSHTVTHNPKEIFPTRQWSKAHTVTHAQPRTQCPSSQGASQSDSWGINSRLAKVSPERNGPGVVDQRSLLKCQNLLHMNFHLSYHCKEKLHGIPLTIITKHTARIWHPNITLITSIRKQKKKQQRSEKLVFNKCTFFIRQYNTYEHHIIHNIWQTCACEDHLSGTVWPCMPNRFYWFSKWSKHSIKYIVCSHLSYYN